MSESFSFNETTAASTSPIDMSITNVVCSFATNCHLNLKRIAMEGLNVEYRKENNMINMKLRKPPTTASIWSSGKITCTGATTEADAYRAARRFCRVLQKMKFKVKLTNYRVVNVLAICAVPFHIDINRLAGVYCEECVYEPELHPGATFKLKETKATLKLFSNGSITLTAPCVSLARKAIDMIYPILLKFKHSSTVDVNVNSAACNKSEFLLVNSNSMTNSNSIVNNSCSMKAVSVLERQPILNAVVEPTNGNGNVYQVYQGNPLPPPTTNSNLISATTNTLNAAFTSSYDSTLFHLNNNFSFGNTAAAVAPNSQSHHWYNDSYLIDSALDDFLP